MGNKTIPIFDEAVSLFKARKYKEAESLFLSLIESNRENKYLLFHLLLPHNICLFF